MNVYELGRVAVAVVGAGHAGCEAALACARMGVDTILFTMSADSIANMPCNPSVGFLLRLNNLKYPYFI